MKICVKNNKTFPGPYWNVGWLDLLEVLCRHSELLWVHKFSESCYDQKTWFALDLVNLWLLWLWQSFCIFFHDGPWVLVRSVMWQRHPICSCVFLSHCPLPAPRTVLSFNVNYHQHTHKTNNFSDEVWDFTNLWCRDINLEGSFILSPLSRMAVVGIALKLLCSEKCDEQSTLR